MSWLRRWLGWLLPPGQGVVPQRPWALGGGSPPKSPRAAAYSQNATGTSAVPERIAAVWQVREPEETHDPVPHCVSQAARREHGWALLGASVRGKLHAHQARWREDSFAWDAAGPWTIIAVSDGAGSAPLARVGSHVATETAVSFLKTQLAEFQLAPTTQDRPAAADVTRCQKVLLGAVHAARQAVEREARQRGRAAHDLSATLLLVVHAPFQDSNAVMAVQVGDGVIGTYTVDGKGIVLGRAEHGTFSGETRFLTSPGTDVDLERQVVFACRKDLRCLAVMTDGVADDFFPEAERLGELFAGRPIRGLRDAQGNPLHGVLALTQAGPDAGEALIGWLRYEVRGSSDDRTLVLLYRDE